MILSISALIRVFSKHGGRDIVVHHQDRSQNVPQRFTSDQNLVMVSTAIPASSNYVSRKSPHKPHSPQIQLYFSFTPTRCLFLTNQLFFFFSLTNTTSFNTNQQPTQTQPVVNQALASCCRNSCSVGPKLAARVKAFSRSDRRPSWAKGASCCSTSRSGTSWSTWEDLKRADSWGGEGLTKRKRNPNKYMD